MLDVKVGRGAFMKTEADARTLAEALVRVGTAAGKRVVALLTDMDAPLGLMVGNALETREAIDVLHGGGPTDLVECTLALGAEMLMLGGVATTTDDARAQLAKAIADGRAAEVMERMIAAQHGDHRVVRDLSLLPVAELQVEVRASRSGVVTAIDPLEIGLSAVSMGAGRTRRRSEGRSGRGHRAPGRARQPRGSGCAAREAPRPHARRRGRDRGANRGCLPAERRGGTDPLAGALEDRGLSRS